MQRHACNPMLLLSVLVAGSACAASETADPPAPYVPTPVYCASGGDALCSVIPTAIGTDDALHVGVGYPGLSNDVTSAKSDVQTPFDNMAWQMFVALNWQASQSGGNPATGLSGTGPTVWQRWSRPEDVFGGPPGNCANPDNLPRFNLIAKSDGQNDEGFLEAATNQPVIDVNGNWTLFERRLNDIEKTYITQNNLDSLAGQQLFAQAGGTVALPMPTATVPGAMEVKAAWRIIDASEQPRYFNIQALLDVEEGKVDNNQRLCAQVTLGLVGLHIIQNNVQDGALNAQFIWASFEHKDNAPTAAAACDATDPNCYKTIASTKASPNLCPVADGTGGFSYYNPACSDLPTNTPPVASPDGDYVWSSTPPYAAKYLTTSQSGASCGTQVSHCWQVYSLTQQLNTAWQAQLAALDSVFANYYLIGTNWGGNVEPDGTTLTNGSVPAFLGNSTMETYIQADPVNGNCVNCHSNATLAYSSGTTAKPVTYPADFSFLLGLADKACIDLAAGPIWNNDAAQTTCPAVCSAKTLQWEGQWTTTVPGTQSVCGCCIVAASHASAEK
ncbi:mannan-binding lectin [Chiayiivirga flava]|nr:mannan-binding lectin [Chiayiivirga flava]